MLQRLKIDSFRQFFEPYGKPYILQNNYFYNVINGDYNNIFKKLFMNKNDIIFALLLVCFGSFAAKAQKVKDNGLLLDNEKLRITQYIANPGKDVCGEGMHTHTDHCNILLTGAKVKVTKPDGSYEIHTFDAENKKVTIEKDGKKLTIPTEGVVWANGETHSVVNIGEKPMKFYIVEVK